MTVLEGPLVRLRPLTPSERREVFDWYNDPEIVAPFDRFSVDTFDEFVHAAETASQDPTSLAPRFAVERKDENKVVGVVGHYRAHPVLEYIDVWYVLGDRAARGRGLGARRSDFSRTICSRPRQSSGWGPPPTWRT